jgi:hypothetical protein
VVVKFIQMRDLFCLEPVWHSIASVNTRLKQSEIESNRFLKIFGQNGDFFMNARGTRGHGVTSRWSLLLSP